MVGFWLPSGSERDGRGDDTGRLNELSAKAPSKVRLEKLTDCMVRASLWVESIPRHRAAGNQVLLTFFVTDKNGASTYGAMTVSAVSGEPRVADVFVDNRFEE